MRYGFHVNNKQKDLYKATRGGSLRPIIRQ